MSEPAKLQQRLNAEFSTVADRGEERRTRRREPEAEPQDSPPASLGAGDGKPDDGTILRIVIAAAGILSAIAVLVTGIAAGFYLSLLSLGLSAVAGAVFLLGQRSRTDRHRVWEAEHRHDREWERDETSQILMAIHDSLGDIVLTRALDGRILHGNAVLGELTGYPRLEGRTCEEIGLSFRSQSAPHRYDVDIATDDGPRTYAWHDVTVRNPATGELAVHSIARDVTEERRAEREQLRARQRAEQASAAKSRLLATVSHEIRTPLSGILGMSHLIGQTRLTAEQKNYLTGVRQSGHALVQLVEDLLDFSTIEVGRFQLRPAQEQVRPLLEGVVEMLSHRAHEKGIEIGSFVSSNVPAVVTVDAPRLRQVLFNVIGNAVKFTHSGGVSLETELQDRVLLIRVSDTGPGMTEEEQARIFEEFEQAGGLSQRSGGTGLGLAISARILREAGGSLTLTSVVGKGSAFVISMPVMLVDSAPASVGYGVLDDNIVLLFSPAGPVSSALCRTIETLGGTCHLAVTVEEAMDVAQHLSVGERELTDIIVDSRLSGLFARELADFVEFNDSRIRRTYLFNAEERTGRALGKGEGYDAWLIRPLRERSLVEVLRGRMKGIEYRDTTNDNRPALDGDVLAGENLVLPQSAGEIVFAEDDPVNALLVRSMLEKAGFKVRHVIDFTELLDVLGQPIADASAPPSLVITDLGMPGGEGIDVIRRIRAGSLGGHRRIPLVVLTADVRSDLRRTLVKAGADVVLVKPAEPQALLQEIGRLLGKTLH
ncbi:ATP-binding protein [Sinorhizobium sp. BG8]|uniref:hybrid sensor histidine kinase/response regulator n=1 Tax=Sinorhizobium sp. BG8 TaxID=2613773 RepID=UPI00193EAA19|nr:ATP-binding protein [Sinorhizobium sp. BG8]QRM54020.1 response regulator [Sinorhizobium sp. BG8]